ncbi:hypothetical protein C1645_783307 [Glomus cerebriforme]|uniref:Uncharacterized protein n=1 Tax=Glomus cerebriforme TaxID=658196 RepID=A0A397SGZ5_9GLOM|nr:hypothetical protein C1645_783307 [Glomus cerebriforme]
MVCMVCMNYAKSCILCINILNKAIFKFLNAFLLINVHVLYIMVQLLYYFITKKSFEIFFDM